MFKYIFLLSFISHIHILASDPPKESWEAWILDLRKNKKTKRPDLKKLSDPLPLWVDCHFSWAFDRKMIKIPRDIILKSTMEQCKDQLEFWANK